MCYIFFLKNYRQENIEVLEYLVLLLFPSMMSENFRSAILSTFLRRTSFLQLVEYINKIWKIHKTIYENVAST